MINKKNLEKFTITKSSSLKSAINKLIKNGKQCLIVVDNFGFFYGIVSDGDLRKNLLKGITIHDKIEKITNRKVHTIDYSKFNQNKAKKLIHEKNLKLIPILKNNRIFDIIYSENNNIVSFSKINANIFILAGGKGNRLTFFSKILPKPLLPINEKPAIIHIMDNFSSYGIKKFNISINYKKDIIKSFFEETEYKNKIKFIEENAFLGTAGSISKYTSINNHPTILINCDVIAQLNYSNLVDFHKSNKYEFTVVVSKVKQTFPYGVCEYKNKKLLKINEKPSLEKDVLVGIYIMNKSVIKLVPKNRFYDMNTLIENLLKLNKNIGVFKIKDTDWKDVGDWSNYSNSQNSF